MDVPHHYRERLIAAPFGFANAAHTWTLGVPAVTSPVVARKPLDGNCQPIISHRRTSSAAAETCGPPRPLPRIEAHSLHRATDLNSLSDSRAHIYQLAPEMPFYG